jgi:hypothetical protein
MATESYTFDWADYIDPTITTGDDGMPFIIVQDVGRFARKIIAALTGRLFR